MPADAQLVGFRGMIAIGCSAILLSFPALAASPPAWEKNVTTDARGSFPNPRPIVATYDFGWSGLVAATARIDFGKSDDHLQLEASGGTVGPVRALWKFDTHHRALADPTTLRPISMHQVDEFRDKTVTTDVVFRRGVLERIRSDTKSRKPPTPKTFRFAGVVFDMHSALLYLRSQPLREGDVYRVVVYPATNAYLATLTVVGHPTVTVGAGTYPSIKLDLQLYKVGKKRELEPHKKFRRASVWVSDDADRLLLRAEASIFIGTVFAELQSAGFPTSSPNDSEPAARDKPAAAAGGLVAP